LSQPTLHARDPTRENRTQRGSTIPHDKAPHLTAEATASQLRRTAEAKRAADELKASELRYRRLFETAKDGILLLDADTGRITDVNPFLEDMLGYSHYELIGKALWEIGPVKDILASQEAMRHLQDKEYIRYENLPLETKTKQRVQVEFVSNVYLVNGVRVIQCNVRDITARKAAEEGVVKLKDDLLAMVADMKLRDREMSRLNHMNDLLHACATQDEAYKVIALMAGELFAGHSGFLAVLHPRDQRLETVARWGEEAAIVPGFALTDCWAMRRGQPHEVVEPRDGLVCRHFIDQPAAGYLCVPLTVQAETLGLLCLIGSPADASRGAVKQQLAVTMGEAIKLSLSNLRLREKLREQATLDVLTGLYNRRYLDESLARELHRALRRKSPLCVAMLDLDHFKRFNDTFGHEAGDTLLRELGHILRDKVRRSDISCRYGGEEFVLVFPDSALEDTRRRVEQVCTLVRELELRHGDQPLGRITVSAGLAQADPAGTTPNDLLRAVDEALYAAKLAGRDRVVEHQPKASPE
jgi:diguanylate cyclase (GGDEF)-like protein/PAS domain S-box-containing protein